MPVRSTVRLRQDHVKAKSRSHLRRARARVSGQWSGSGPGSEPGPGSGQEVRARASVAGWRDGGKAWSHVLPWQAPPEFRRSRLHGTRMRCGTLNCSSAETKREVGQRIEETRRPPGTWSELGVGVGLGLGLGFGLGFGFGFGLGLRLGLGLGLGG